MPPEAGHAIDSAMTFFSVSEEDNSTVTACAVPASASGNGLGRPCLKMRSHRPLGKKGNEKRPETVRFRSFVAFWGSYFYRLCQLSSEGFFWKASSLTISLWAM